MLEPRWQRATAGASFSLSLGIGKEAYDAAGGGDPSFRDFTWDVIGTAVGVGIALLIDLAVGSDDSPSEPAAQNRAASPLRWCW